MSRRRTVGFLETQRSAPMELPGKTNRADGDCSELDREEELLGSVSDITEHLKRSIAAVLEAAQVELRRAVGVRIQVLKAELSDKNREIERLRARLDALQGDGRDPEPSPESGPARLPFSPGAKLGGGAGDPRRARPLIPEVKRENIDAICDYLMKDKNARGCGEMDPELGVQTRGEGEVEADALSLWSDGRVDAAGDPNSTSDYIFSSLPPIRRIYDYEWMAPGPFPSQLKDVKQPECENPRAGVLEDEDDDAEELPGREGGGQKSAHAGLSHVQLCEGSAKAQRSPQAEDSPMEDNAARLETGQPFAGLTYICSLCGTFCPDSAFLEDHIKLIHPEADDAPAAGTQKFFSPGGAAAGDDGGSDSGAAAMKGPGGGGGPGLSSGQGAGPLKREIKTEGGYECGDCGRHFNYLGNLRQHQRIHTGEKPFACPECGERFRHAARLKSHRLVHGGAQSPFPCPQCGKGFSVLSGLKRHQRVHTGESPYACPECGRCFKELGNLYTHQRIHSGATPYCCQQCGRCFRHLGTYKSHRCSPAP